MATENFEVTATSRTEAGSAAVRRMRRAGSVPAILYGGKGEPASLSLQQNEMMKHLSHEAFYSHILTVKVDGKEEKAILKDLQRHPFRQEIMHVDFQRVVAGEKLHMNVPLHFLNEATSVGVKNGGLVQHLMTEVEIQCLPKDLPEYLEIDMAEVGIGDTLHLSDIKLPEGVEVVALSHDDDQPVAQTALPKLQAEPEETDEADVEAESGEDDAKDSDD